MVHAHPDDESIATGGTLAHYAATGADVTLITCTLGEEGEIIPAELRGLGAQFADQLGGYRHVELGRACEALGVTDRRYLGGIGRYRDSGMAGTPSAEHPRALVHTTQGAAVDAAAAELVAVTELVAVLDEVEAEVVVSYAPDGGYGHPDHVAAHLIARGASRAAPSVRRFFSVVRPQSALVDALDHLPPVTGYAAPRLDDLGFVVPDSAVDVRVPVRQYRQQHRAALAAHATQIDLLPDGFALSNRISQPIFDAEYFQLLDGDPLPFSAAPGDDLFAGLS